MELIVAVYDDWGIGRDGTQPIALSADRKFFRENTRGCMVIVGRRTIADFPGQKPLPGRVNVALTRTQAEIPGFTICGSPEEAVKLAQIYGSVQEQQKARVAGLLHDCAKDYPESMRLRFCKEYKRRKP